MRVADRKIVLMNTGLIEAEAYIPVKLLYVYGHQLNDLPTISA